MSSKTIIMFCFYLLVATCLLSCRTGPYSEALDKSLNEAFAYFKAGDFERAETTYKAVIRSHPRSLKAYRGLVRCFVATKKAGEAKALFMDMSKNGLAPDVFNYTKGLLSLAKGTEQAYLDAAAWFDEAAGIEPSEPEYHYRAGLSLLMAQRAVDAWKRLEKAIELSPEEASYYPAAADASVALGKPEIALKLLSDMVEHSPSRRDVELGLEVAAKLAGPFKGIPEDVQGEMDATLKAAENGVAGDSLLRRIDELIEKHRDAPVLHYLKGLAEIEKGDRSTGVAELKRAIELAPFWSDPLMALATLYESLGRNQDAIHAYEEAVRVNPVSIEARHGLAAAYHSAGKIGKAAEQLGKLVALTQGSVPARLAYAGALFDAGKTDEARSQLESILHVQEDNLEAIYRLALLELQAAGDMPASKAKDALVDKVEGLIERLEKLSPADKKRREELKRLLESTRRE